MNQTYLEIQGKSMGPKQREFLKRLAQMAQSRFEYPIMVNIGVLLGCSLACLRAGSPGGVIVGVDINLKRRRPAAKHHAYLKAVLIECDSHQFAGMFRGPAHLVLVDGGHSYKVALGDLRLWSEKVPVGGIMAIHDLHMGQVQQAFTEWYNPKVWKKVKGNPVEGFRAYERIEDD